MKLIYVDDERSSHVNFYYDLKDRAEIDTVSFFFKAEEAIEYATNNPVDCAFLDINIGGASNGLMLAKRLKEIQPLIEIVFVTGYDEYARESYRVGGRAYITKPYTQKELEDALSVVGKLIKINKSEKETANREKERVKIKTFGNFDLIVDERSVACKSAKAKELLAFLVNQRGGTVSSAQVFLALWENQEYTTTNSTYVRRAVRSLKDELEALGIADIFISKRNCYSVDTTRFVCDYYDLMDGKKDTIYQYNGEYMCQYSWGETTIPLIERKISSLESK